MSGLYNSLFGVEPTAEIALVMLGVKPEEIPRFRDAYLTIRNEIPVIVIFTRTGGGNRDFYDSYAKFRKEYPDDDYKGPFNEDLKKINGFIDDKDDDFDSTYAYFYFNVPNQYMNDAIDIINYTGIPMSLKEKFTAALGPYPGENNK